MQAEWRSLNQSNFVVYKKPSAIKQALAGFASFAQCEWILMQCYDVAVAVVSLNCHFAKSGCCKAITADREYNWTSLLYSISSPNVPNLLQIDSPRFSWEGNTEASCWSIASSLTKHGWCPTNCQLHPFMSFPIWLLRMNLRTSWGVSWTSAVELYG